MSQVVVSVLFKLLDDFLVSLINLRNDVIRQLSRVESVFVLLHVILVVLVDVTSLVFLTGLVRNVNQPVGSHLSIAAICHLEDFALLDVSDTDVIEPAPLVLVVVSDESEVVPTLSRSIVNDDCMEVVLGLVQVVVGLFDLILEIINLSLKLIFLVLHLIHR